MCGYDEKCRECEYRKKHEEYLKSQRKYEIGEKIDTFQELMDQNFVFVGSLRSPMHIEAIKSWQVRTVLNRLDQGRFYKAIKRESED